VNYGLHFTGGEPFLDSDLLLDAVRTACELGIPSTFVETNAFWALNEQVTREKLIQLKEAGLHGILISVNPFILEEAPFERTERAARSAAKIFGENLMLYQEFFYHRFTSLNVRSRLPLSEYLRRTDLQDFEDVELLPMGRAVYVLAHLYRKYPAGRFYGQSCREDLTRGWHVHVDNYSNYMTGYCGGISLGDARDLDSILRGIELDDRPVLDALVTDMKRLVEFGVRQFNYRERQEGYISKCHLCVDVRRHIARATDEFKELGPRQFYDCLE